MIFNAWKKLEERFYNISDIRTTHSNHNFTTEAFSEKWEAYAKEEIVEQEKLFEFQKNGF